MRPDDDKPVGIRLANDGEGVHQQLVPPICCQLIVRFIEELEQQIVGVVLVVLGDLPPQAKEALPVLGREHDELLVVVDVDHHQ